MKDFLKNLATLRGEKKLTQLDVAKKCGVTLNTFANWERGACNPSPENLKILKRIMKGGE